MGGSNSGALKGRRSWRMIFKQSSKQKQQKALSFENELDVHKEEEKGWRGYDKHKDSDGHWGQLADDKSPTNIQTEKPPTQSPQCTCNNFHPKICWKLICWMVAKKKKMGETSRFSHILYRRKKISLPVPIVWYLPLLKELFLSKAKQFSIILTVSLKRFAMIAGKQKFSVL